LNISKMEQRALHALAQGGCILLERNAARKIIKTTCFNREGWVLSGFSISLFRKLKRRKLITSRRNGPYRISHHGLMCVRAQLDNR